MTSGLGVSARRGTITSQAAPPSLSDHSGPPTLSNIMPGFTSNFSVSTATAPLSSGPDAGEVTCWLLDTREIWPGTSIWSAPGAAEALSLVSLPEQKTITTKMFIQDARMSLGSALLKRLYISQTLDIPWKDVKLTRKGDIQNGKPCACDHAGRPIEGIDFNVSHQAGLVTLIGWNGKKQHKYAPDGGVQGFIAPGENYDPDVMVGTDIVYVNERNDWRTIDVEGLDGWVDVYEFVFSEEERWSMIHDVDYVTMLDGTILSREEIGRHDRHVKRHIPISLQDSRGITTNFQSDRIVEAKLRRFYTYFCYKEAYIKLAGEALLAPWLKQLEFFNVRSPKPGTPARCSTHGQWGEEVDDVEVHLNGREVSDVRMKIQAYEENFMLATSVQGKISKVTVPAFRKLDLMSEVIDYAHKHINLSPSDSI